MGCSGNTCQHRAMIQKEYELLKGKVLTQLDADVHRKYEKVMVGPSVTLHALVQATFSIFQNLEQEKLDVNGVNGYDERQLDKSVRMKTQSK